jgi:hypothetical protein
MAPLDSVWLKVERAKEHRDTLEQYIDESFSVEANRPRLGLKFEPETGDNVLYVNYVPDLQWFLDRCSIILGDTVHNFVSALDRLSYQLAVLHTSGAVQKPNSVQFPICDTPETFAAARKRWLKEVAPAHIAIIERFQGHNGVDDHENIGGPYFHPLSMLRDLAGMDKHRMPIDVIIPTDSLQDTPAMIQILGFMQATFSGNLRTLTEPKPAELGTVVCRCRLPPDLASKAQMDMAGYVAAGVAINRQYRAVALVDKVAAMVVKVVREFEPIFKS